MSPTEHSQPSARAHWAAILQQARLELETLSGETFILPGAPKQAASPLTTSSPTDFDETSWSVVVKKKKGKKGKKDKKAKTNISTGSSSTKPSSPSHPICGSFMKPVSWQTREVMKARTEWRHKKQRVYTYTPLPAKDLKIYQDTKVLSKSEKRRIIGSHRFHPQHGLETVPESGAILLLKPRLPRVDPIPQQRLGPVAVIPAPVQASIKTPSWSQVVVKPAVPEESKVQVKASFARVSVTPPVSVSKPAVPEVSAAKTPVTLKKEKLSPTLGGLAPTVSPETPKLPKSPVDSRTLRRQDSGSLDIDKSTPSPTQTLLWSQVAAKPAVPEVHVKP